MNQQHCKKLKLKPLLKTKENKSRPNNTINSSKKETKLNNKNKW